MEKNGRDGAFLNDLSILYRATQKYFDAVLMPYGLGWGVLIALFAIYEEPGITMQKINTVWSVDKATITKAISKLVTMDYVVMAFDDHDHRVKHLYTTAKAKDIMPQLYRYRKQYMDVVLDTMDEATMKQWSIMASHALTMENRYENDILLGAYKEVSLLPVPGYISAYLKVNGCDFQCPYCFEEELLYGAKAISFQDILPSLKQHQSFLDYIAIGGGEPLAFEKIEELCMRLKKQAFKVAIETNGYQSEVLKRLIDKQCLDYVMMDLKGVQHNYFMHVGRLVHEFQYEKIQESMNVLKASGIDHAYSITVGKDMDDSLVQEMIDGIDDGVDVYLQARSGEVVVEDVRTMAKRLKSHGQIHVRDYQKEKMDDKSD